MKWKFARYALLVAAFGMVVNTVDAQTRKKSTRKTTTSAKKTTDKKTQANVANANLDVAEKDTMIVKAPPKAGSSENGYDKEVASQRQCDREKPC